MKNHQQIEDLVKQNQLQAETVRQLNERIEAYIRKDTEEVIASNSTLTTASPLIKTTIPLNCQEQISCCNPRGETYKIISCK